MVGGFKRGEELNLRSVQEDSEHMLKSSAGYRSNSIAINSITVKSFMLKKKKNKNFKPTLKAYPTQEASSTTKSPYNKRM